MTTDTTTGPRVVVLHNVQRLCRTCDQPVYPVAPDRYFHRDPLIDHPVESALRAGWGRGYAIGDSLSPVFVTELPAAYAGFASSAAGRVYSATVAPVSQLPEFEAGLAGAYGARQLRPLSAGDVLVIDGQALTIDSDGDWTTIAGRLRQVVSAEPGSWSMAFCTYCQHVPADRADLEEFNRAANLACRDVVACAERCNTPTPPVAAVAEVGAAPSLGPSYRVNNHYDERGVWCRSSLTGITANLYRTGDGRCFHNCPDSAYEEVPADAR